jgi:hypothetical protein
MTEIDHVNKVIEDRIKGMRRAIDRASMDKWTMITVRNWDEVDTDWCLKYLEGEYLCLGYYWYFEREEDVIMFALRWS